LIERFFDLKIKKIQEFLKNDYLRKIILQIDHTDRKIRYLTPILHLSVPDMCSMNVEKHTLFIYISGTY
jgi:hypothetical protein